MRLIILPQALKISIPGIVNVAVGLFKDTAGLGHASDHPRTAAGTGVYDLRSFVVSQNPDVFIGLFNSSVRRGRRFHRKDEHGVTLIRCINALEERPGERIVIAVRPGPESTLIRCINALEEHQQGEITVDGTRPEEHRQDPLRSGDVLSSTSTCFRI